MSGGQLSLFDWKRSVEIHAFPLDRRVGKIRRVCAVLESKHGNDADAYWRTIIKGMADQLKRAGISEVSIERELLAFSITVRDELRNRWIDHQPTGD